MKLALRTQQIIAEETNVTQVIDPLGGSYYVEALTDRMEQLAYDYFAQIDELGGMVEAVKQGFPQREIAEASYQLQQEIDRGERTVVGVNAYADEEEEPVDILHVDPELERKQVDRVRGVRAARDAGTVERVMAGLREAAADPGRNLMPNLLDCGAPTPPRARSSPRCRRSSAATARPRSTRSACVPDQHSRAAPRGSRQSRPGRPRPRRQDHRPRRCGTPAWRSSTPACIRRPSRSWPRPCRRMPTRLAFSILSGAHMTLVPRIVKLLRERHAEDVVVLVGGTIPARDIPALEELGVTGVFTPGAKVEDIVAFFRAACQPATAAAAGPGRG